MQQGTVGTVIRPSCLTASSPDTHHVLGRGDGPAAALIYFCTLPNPSSLTENKNDVITT